METQIQIDTEPICTIATRSGDLLKTLKVVAPLAKPNKLLPICEYILVKISEKTLTAKSTNTQETIEVTHELDGIYGSIESCIPAEQVVGLLSSFSADTQIIIEFYEEHMIIGTQEQNYTLKTFYPIAFPSTDSSKEILTQNIDTELLTKIINLRYAAAKTDPSKSLPWQSVLLDFTIGGMTAVATSGQIVHLISNSDKAFVHKPVKVMILASSLELLKPLILGEDTVKLVVMFNHIKFIINNTTFQCLRVDGDYPDYAGIFPKTYNYSFSLYRNPLLLALERISLLHIYDGQLLLEFAYHLEITARNIDTNSFALEKIELSKPTDSQKITVSFPLTNLKKIIKNLEATEVNFEMTQSNRMVKIWIESETENISETAAIMPIMPYNYE